MLNTALPRLARRAREHPLLALAAFGVAAAMQFWATQVLVSGELPDRFAAGEGEELVLAGLGNDPRLLSLEERGGLDVRFDRARLAPPTAALLQQLGVALPSGEGSLAWISGAGEEAPSLLEVAPAEGAAPRQLVLRTLPSLADGVARLELEADAPLTVSLATALVPGQAAAPRRLLLGQTELKVDGALPVQVQVPAGSPLRLALSLAGPQALAGLTPGSLREGREGRKADGGLALASLGLRRGDAPYAGFACAAAPGAWLWRGSASLARGDCAGAARLRLLAVELKPGEVATQLAGSGWLWADGRPASAHLLARLTANPALAVLLVMADGVLAAWLALALLNLRRRGRYRVFISYRRGDSAGHAGRLTRCLEESLGQDAVFFDVDDIAPGTPFGPHIVDRIAAAEAVLAVISQYWLAASDEKSSRRRLDEPEDWVRRELETALTQGKRVIPVLVGGARMPTEAELPTSLKALAGLNAVLIEEAHFERDVEALAEVLDEGAAAAPTPDPAGSA
jgi:TIR domain-containing protein